MREARFAESETRIRRIGGVIFCPCLAEYGYLPTMEEAVDPGFFFWAFSPEQRNAEGLEVCFEFAHYRSGDNEAAFGILLIALLAAVGLSGFVLLRRKYVLQEERERRMNEQVMEQTGEN